ncbi:MmgE/PrpD family protein [Pseudarthrobacter oxydans]|uniref:MmgE/PrpD family protein n=1 Tax=Pseudarthrobacter oxydans TaxID=1671 RepID=UPI003D2A6039
MPQAQDLVHDLAAIATQTQYTQLPPAAVEAAKKSILDTLGVALAASGTEPAVLPIIDFVRHSGGRREATVWGFGGKVPAHMAAMANGAMVHCLDFDDHTPWGQHSSSSIVPAALAVAERQGGVSGKDLITAVALGQDLFARLRCNVGWRKDWNLSTVLGVFAGTVAAGRLIGLSQMQMVAALSIASMHSSGVMEVVTGTGSDLRGMYAGFSAKGSVLASLLAERGTTGVDTLFEGRYGFFETHFRGEYDRDSILDGLGQTYLGSKTLYKRWPTVGTSHSHIHAVVSLVTENDLKAEDVAEIRVYVGDYHALMCMPLEARRTPSTTVDAKFSLPFLVAVAALNRDVTIADLAEESLHDPRVRSMAQRVIPVPDESLDWKLELPPGRVRIITHDGREWERVGEQVPGGPEEPLSWNDISAKFAACASVAVVAPSDAQIRQLQQMACELEQVSDATRILKDVGQGCPA